MAQKQGVISEIKNKDAWSEAAEGYNTTFAHFPLHCGRAGMDAAQVQAGVQLPRAKKSE